MVGIRAELRQALDQVLAPIEAGLRSDLAGQVLTGDRPDAVTRLAAVPDAAQLLGFAGVGTPELVTAQEIWGGGLRELPTEVTLRWVRVYSAALWTDPHEWPTFEPIAGETWAEALLVQHARPICSSVDHELIERLLVAAGADPASLLQRLFAVTAKDSYRFQSRQSAACNIGGYDAAVRRHLDVLRSAARLGTIAGQHGLYRMLGKLESETLAGFAPEIAQLLASPSQPVRAEATKLGPVEGLSELMKVIAVQGEPEQRRQALSWLWRAGETRWAEKQAGADRTSRVRALLTDFRDEEQPAPAVRLPAVDWRVEVSTELRRQLTELWAAIDEDDLETFSWRGGGDPRFEREPGGPPVLSAEELADFVADLSAGVTPRSLGTERFLPALAKSYLRHGPREIRVATALLVRLDALIDSRRTNRLTHHAVAIYNGIHADTGRPTMIELAAQLNALGLDGTELLLNAYREDLMEPLARDWAADAVRPFVQHALPRFVDILLAGPSHSYDVSDEAVYRALGTLDAMPGPALIGLLADAVGPRKTVRPLAQDALVRVPGIGDRVIEQLAAGRSEARAEAAAWLGRLGHEPAVEAIAKALAEEKNDLAKGAMLDALVRLGQPVEQYIDRAALAAEAVTALAKGLPKDIDWVDWDKVPLLRWADSGEGVPLEVLQLLLVRALRSKSPEPNALLRHYFALVDPADREAFGQWLLEGWLRNDTIASKGLLAVVAVCAGAGVAPPVASYLKKWYGYRAAQGKALIAMLGWVEDPSAVQLMLSVGSRFRTKGFQEESTRQAEALAERKGWTVAELADRTIPVAGFEDDGRLELSYGPRVFTAVLLPDLSIELRTSEGAKLGALPDPRQSDNPDAAKAARKALSLTRKELKVVVQAQSSRLYEALCTQRTWVFQDWDRYLNRHAVARYLVQRLVWATGGDKRILFRPLADGTLADLDGDIITLPADCTIMLAHDSLLDTATAQRWQQHVYGQAVKPLFQQFGRGVYELPARLAREYRISDFQGRQLEAFALRNRAGELGYLRGETGDKAWFYEYERKFPSLGLVAQLGFSGNQLPEENRPVELTTIGFVRVAASAAGRPAAVRLGEVPKVLLSEVYNDARRIAAVEDDL